MTNTAKLDMIVHRAALLGFSVEIVRGFRSGTGAYVKAERRENGVQTHEISVRFSTAGTVIEVSAGSGEKGIERIDGKGKFEQVLAWLDANDAPKQTAVEQISRAADVAGFTVFEWKTTRCVEFRLGSTTTAARILVDFDSTGRLVSADRWDVERHAWLTMPATGLKSRVIAWIDEHKPAPVEPAVKLIAETETLCDDIESRQFETGVKVEALRQIGALPRVSASNPSTPTGDEIFDALETAYVEIDGFGTRDEYVSPRAPKTTAASVSEPGKLTVQIEAKVGPTARRLAETAADAAEMVDRAAARGLRTLRTLPSRTIVTGKCGPDCRGWCVLDGRPCGIEPLPAAEPAPVTLDVSGPWDAPRYEVGQWDDNEREHVHAMMLSRRAAELLHELLGRALAD